MTTGNRIKLYYHVEGLGLEAVPFLYVLKEGVDLTTLPTGVGFARKFANKSTYDRLRPMISDNPEALRVLDKIVPTREAFVNLINRYNQSFENE
ncbi:hypothetical protein [Maribacter sp. 4G9]|uniref:hypothetical protein n=1 Tax=Maribacter sp. 4G9 TaxID=1889777 RepID=UPI000C154593|nr:hypothetical protein [Maribacter sp. 4G9]PIB31474.1 hypothetical protein BFP75_20720 [Maribacter sp. 4G9]